LLAAHVEDPPAPPGTGGGRLEQERGLADARLAADQRDRTRHQPTVEDPIELGHPRGHRLPAARLDVGDGPGRAQRAEAGGRLAGAGARRLVGLDLDLVERVPARAGRALALPLDGLGAAVAAPVADGRTSHAPSLPGGCDTYRR